MPIATIRCAICDKDFKARESARRIYCSRECYGKMLSVSQRRRIETECQRCGKPMSVIPSDIKRGYGKYCSAVCRYPEKLVIHCAGCGCEFQVSPSESRRKYCGRACQYGGRILKHCLECGKEMLVKPSLASRKKFCSRSCMGKQTLLATVGHGRYSGEPWNKGTRGAQVAWNRGIPATWIQGDKNPNWKGGKTALMDAIRTCSRYKEWRRMVFDRDGYRCVFCGREGRVQADHVKPLAVLVDMAGISTLEEALEADELFDAENGRTLCGDCHRETDTFGVNFIRWEKQQEFLQQQSKGGLT